MPYETHYSFIDFYLFYYFELSLYDCYLGFYKLLFTSSANTLVLVIIEIVVILYLSNIYVY